MAGFPSSPLLAKFGSVSGRLVPVNSTAVDGSYVFVLGADKTGVKQPLVDNDSVEVATVGDLLTNGYTYVRFNLRIRPPASMPGGKFWRLMLAAADNADYDSSFRILYDLSGTNNHEVTRNDLAIPLKGLLSLTRQRILFHLELQTGGASGVTEDVELPGIYVDSVQLDSQAQRPTLINRIPEPNETRVPINSNIYIEINDPITTAANPNVDLAQTQVYVNGTLAYNGAGGGFQTGFNGGGSTVFTLDGARTTAIVIDPTSNFAPSTVINVRVLSNVFGIVQNAIEFNYSFTTQDLVAPTLVAAESIARRTVRVTASEPLRTADPTGANDALNPANWSLLVTSTSLDDGLPAVTPTVIAVAKVDDATFELGLDIEITRGANYHVIGGPIADAVGNLMVAPNNFAAFVGYACEAPDGREFDLIDMLPALNVNEDESLDLHKFVGCLQEVTDNLLCDIDHWPDILDPDVAPERFVDAMLADIGNPFSFSLNEVDKRRLIHVLVPLYQQKGTDPGIINAIRFFLGIEVTIFVPAFSTTWTLGVSLLGTDTWLGTSSLHDRLSFYVVSPVTLTQTQRDQITSIVNYMKDARTHFLGIQEPAPPPPVPNHMELGLSELGVNWLLH
jgi:phage tail-like protein